MRNVLDMMAQGGHLLKSNKPQTAFRYRFDDRPQKVGNGYEHKSVVRTVEFLMATQKGPDGKPITAEQAVKLMNERGMDPQMFFKSQESLKIGTQFGTPFGGFKIVEGEENPEVLQKHVELLTIANKIVPFADVYLAPKFETWTGEGKTNDTFLQLYQPFAQVHHVHPSMKGTHGMMMAKTPVLLIATDNTFEQALYGFLLGLWGLIEEAINEVWDKDFLPALSASIITNDSTMANTGDLDMVQRRFLAWYDYASRRITQKNISFDAALMTGPDQIFEQVWRGEIGRRLAKLIPTSISTDQLRRQFPIAARKTA